MFPQIWLALSLAAALVADVRSALTRGDFAAAERLIADYRTANGVTPEMIEAHSWLGRGSLAGKRLDEAEKYAAESKRLALEQLRRRTLKEEPRLVTALGAAIEVQGQVLAARGERDRAVLYLRDELAVYRNTPMNARIQKNINLISLEGKPVPGIPSTAWLGKQPPALEALRGRPVLLFLWAHWCSDCKKQAPVIARIQEEFGSKGLVVMAPTQRYGYAERGREVGPAEELRHIEKVRQEFYRSLLDVAVPVSEEAFQTFGVSTTPTLVLVDRAGRVALYHPGQMTYEALAEAVRKAS